MVGAAAAIGRLVADRYRLEAELGRGGSAIVYRAHDVQLDRQIALKLVEAEPGATADSSAFIEEARAAATLPDAHVVTVFDAGVFEGRPFIVMEYLEGGSLRDLLDRRGPLPPAEAARIALGVARGLAAVHARGLVHCDVKPLNVLLTREHRPKLVDFGIARRSAATSARGRDEIVGSAPYLSPEQVRGEPIDVRTDVYALGILLYELLAGEPPFRGHAFAEVATQRLHARPRPIREAAPGRPPELAAVVERALAVEPAKRYPDAAAMADALAAVTRAGAAGGVYDATTRVAARSQVVPQQLRRPPAGWLRGLGLPGLSPVLPLTAAIALLGLVSLVLARPLVEGAVAAKVAVPSVAGLPYEAAVIRLQDVGLEATRQDEVTLETPRGVVVTQDPAAEASVKKGRVVRLLVSSGIKLPNFVGQHWDHVKPWMDANGWKLGRVRFVVADRKDFGKVLAQDPPANAETVASKQDSPISLQIAGPPEATNTGFPRSGTAPPPPQVERSRDARKVDERSGSADQPEQARRRERRDDDD